MTREEQIYKKAEGDCIAMLESIERGDIIKGSICPQSYRAGFMDGAKWADQYPQWISVEDELPTIPENYICIEVLFRTKYGANNLGKYFGDKWISYEDYTYKTEDISYWMLLPEPPKKMSNINKDINDRQQDDLTFAKRMIQNSCYGDYCLEKCYINLIKNTKDKMTINELVQTLENMLDIPEGKHLFAVFENNESDEIKGFIVAECVEGARFPKGDISDYPLLSSADLIEKYRK